MKLTIIWTLPTMTLGERIRRTRDLVNLKIAARLPKRIAYWSFILQGSAAIKDDEIVPDANYTVLLSRLDGTPHA